MKLLFLGIRRIGIASLFITTTLFEVFGATPVKKDDINTVEINLELKNESLLKAFKKIEDQTPFHFMYRNAEVKNIRYLNVPAERKSVAAFLNIILSGTSLTYRQVDRRILISPKPVEILSSP